MRLSTNQTMSSTAFGKNIKLPLEDNDKLEIIIIWCEQEQEWYIRSTRLRDQSRSKKKEAKRKKKLISLIIQKSKFTNSSIMKKEEIKMEVSAKSSITFSINGILSSPKRHPKDSRTPSPSSSLCDYKECSDNERRQNHQHFVSSTNTSSHLPYDLPVLQARPTMERDYHDYKREYFTTHELKRQHSYPNWSTTRAEHFHPYVRDHKSTDYTGSIIKRQLSPSYTNRTSVISPPSERSSPDSTKSTASEKRSSPTGRFRPPPFFETVLSLRKRLYDLGGRAYPTDEPPTDRNVHKLWRAVEKHKVNYSLQHYFYVASLTNRCFDLVERINHKVTLGLLEGSREKEVNQSYFNFLYGKTENERFRLLALLEQGEVSPKDFVKPKSSSNKKTDQSHCRNCGITIQKLQKEKKEYEEKYEDLKRKYEVLLETKSKQTK